VVEAVVETLLVVEVEGQELLSFATHLLAQLLLVLDSLEQQALLEAIK
jgi:hypothetical protein